MKKSLHVLMIALLGTLLCSNVRGQVPATLTQGLGLGLVEVTQMKWGVTVPKILLTLAPVSAGLAIASSTTSPAQMLQMSSIINGTFAVPVFHTLKASISIGVVPEGTLLQMGTLPPSSGTRGGDFGDPKILTDLPMKLADGSVTIIDKIGSCFTGNGITDGYALTYTWGIDVNGNYEDIRATPGTDVTVTLTLSSAP